MRAHPKEKTGKVRETVRHIHLIPLFAVVFLCIALIVIYAFSVQRDINREAADNIQEDVAGSIGAISNVIGSSVNVLEGTARQLGAVIPENFSELNAALGTVARLNEFMRVNVCDTQGTMFLENGSSLDVGGEKFYADALGGHITISDPFADPVTGKKIVAFTVPIMNGEQAAGLLVGSKEYEELSRELSRDFQNFHGYAYIINNDGDIIFHAEQSPRGLGEANYGLSMEEQADGLGEANYYLSMEEMIDGLSSQMERMKADLSAARGGTDVLSGAWRRTGERLHGCIGYEPLSVRTDWNIVCLAPFGTSTAHSRSILYKSILLTAALILLLTLTMIYILWAEKQRRREIDRIQDTDALTGASSYSKFCRDAQRLLRENKGTKYALSYSDIRGFKLLNDTLGYETGDRVLRHIADMLREDILSNETFARVSGDNFIIMRAYEKREDLIRRFERIADRAQDFEDTKRNGFTVRICSGILCVEDLREPLSVSGMLDRANYAQKKAKSGQENCAFYSEEIREQVLLEQDLENRMESSLARGEFIVFYQPKFSPLSNRPAGAEALVRWRDAQRGFLPPAVFIPLFERNHFIARLDRYVFESVCRDLSRWIEGGNEPLRVSVNVSRMQLRHSDFVSLYTRIRDRYHLPPGIIEVEFTESIAYENMDAFSEIVRELHRNGFLCSLDDFGSGYSSLGLLGGLSVDVLKLDRQFFLMEEDKDKKRGEIVVRSVISMAHQLDMEVVAEGVETQEQLDMLREMGCDLVQGYIYAKPLPREEFEALVLSSPKAETSVSRGPRHDLAGAEPPGGVDN